jgi:hypothetical protein
MPPTSANAKHTESQLELLSSLCLTANQLLPLVSHRRDILGWAAGLEDQNQTRKFEEDMKHEYCKHRDKLDAMPLFVLR